MNEEIRRLMKKSDLALEVAISLMERSYPSDAASKIYYSMFYAAQALLKSEGIEMTRHSGVESALGYHFVKAGKLAPHFHRMFLNARKLRETADYDIQEEIIEPVATLRIEDGKAYLAEIKSILTMR